MLRTPLALLRQMNQALQQKRAADEKPAFATSEEAALSGYSTQRLG
jgi:hypothetical protein